MTSNTLENFIVFYIEDEIMINKVIAGLLRLTFPNLHTFENPIPALQMIDNNIIPDIIITDIVMPKMDGIKMVEVIREKGIQSPVIITSGNSQQEYQESIDLLNIVGYLQKPTNVVELCSLVQNVVLKNVQKECGI